MEYVVFGIAVCCAVVAFALFHIYMGIHASLSNANVGEIYNFQYLQPKSGDHERYMVKILGVHTLTAEQIQRLNRKSYYRRNDSSFERTSHLVTGQSPDGTIRNFYAERVVNCRKPLLAGAMFKTGLANLLF